MNKNHGINYIIIIIAFTLLRLLSFEGMVTAALAFICSYIVSFYNYKN